MEGRKPEKIPLEAAVKYLVKERDGYKAKLEKLIPYTKMLEQGKSERIQNLEQEVKKLRTRLDRKNLAYEEIMKENYALKRGYKDTQWYASMQESLRYHRTIENTLRNALNRALCENKRLRDGEEHVD